MSQRNKNIPFDLLKEYLPRYLDVTTCRLLCRDFRSLPYVVCKFKKRVINNKENRFVLLVWPPKRIGMKLIKIVLQNPLLDKNYALEEAVISGNSDVVEYLLQESGVDSAIHNNRPIIYASHYGWPKVVELLLRDKRVDPSAQENKAFSAAYRGRRREVMCVLIRDPSLVDT